MIRAIVGYTGFVGSNILQFINFDHFYNSKNFNEAIGKEFDELYISALPAEKWKVNRNPEDDFAVIKAIKEIILTITVKKVILISTIDVYEYSNSEENEDYNCDWMNNHHYGRNRYLFEEFISRTYEDYHILRLPALFGKGLKKNLLYDLLNDNQINKIPVNSSFQWYNLEWIGDDINYAIENNIKVLNLFTEPLNTNEIVTLFHDSLISENQNVVNYNIKTKYYPSGYIRSNVEVLDGIKNFIIDQKRDKSKLRVANIFPKKISQLQFVSILKLHGINNIQIAPTTLINSWDNLDELNLSYLHGCKINSLQSIAYGIDSNIFEDSALLMKHLKRIIDKAYEFQIDTLVFGCPKNRNKNGNYSDELFIDFFREIGDYCLNKNVFICLEPNSQQYTNYLNTIEETGNIVNLINHDNIKLMVDVGHVDDLENIYKFKDIIYNIDISQRGMVDFSVIQNEEKILRFKNILNDINYEGKINLEMISNGENELRKLKDSLNNFINIFY